MKSKILLLIVVMNICFFNDNLSAQTATQIDLSDLYVDGQHYILNASPSQFPQSVNICQNITIIGRLLDSSNNPVPFDLVGVQDGMGLVSTTTQTNLFGEFTYSTNVNSNACGPRSILFFLLGLDYKELFFRIEINSSNNLLSSDFLSQLKDELNVDFPFSLNEIAPFENNGELLFAGPQIIPNYYDIQLEDITQDNFYIVLNQEIHQTNPFMNNPEIWDRAYEKRREFQNSHFQIFWNELKNSTGPARIVVYIAAGAFCLHGNVAGCYLIGSMAGYDIAKAMAMTLFEEAGASDTQKAMVNNAATVLSVFLGNPKYAFLEGYEYISDQAYLKYQMAKKMEIIEKANSKDNSHFTDVSLIEFNPGEFDIQFNFLDEFGNVIPERIYIDLPPDLIDPEVVITSPINGTTISGNVEINALRCQISYLL